MAVANTPDSCTAAIVYASSGCPASGRMFFPGTRFEPARAGMRVMQLGFALIMPPVRHAHAAEYEAQHQGNDAEPHHDIRGGNHHPRTHDAAEAETHAEPGQAVVHRYCSSTFTRSSKNGVLASKTTHSENAQNWCTAPGGMRNDSPGFMSTVINAPPLS